MAPIFIFGSPRSGTSMLHWSLARHSRLWGSAETDFLFDWVKGTTLAWDAGNVHGELHWLQKEKVSREEFFGFAGSGVDAMYLSRSGGKRWLEQTPRYVFIYDALRLMFPGAHFVHIVRDGRQAVNSMQEKFGWPFGRCLRTWKRHVEAGLAASRQNHGDLLQVHYEGLVSDPLRSMNAIFDFMEEELESTCLEALEQPINTAPGREVESPLQKLDPERVDWNPLRAVVFRLVCGSLQESLGYGRDGKREA
jgi:hypothetical protein